MQIGSTKVTFSEFTPSGRWGSLLSWYSFPRDIARADLTGDVVNSSGAEENFPWYLAPLRALAILSAVGLGAPMGTKSPAAHIGVATGSWLGSTNPALHRLVRPAAIGGEPPSSGPKPLTQPLTIYWQ